MRTGYRSCSRAADCTPDNTDGTCDSAAGSPCACTPVGNGCGGECTPCEETEQCGNLRDDDCDGFVDEGETETCNGIDDDLSDEDCATCRVVAG